VVSGELGEGGGETGGTTNGAEGTKGEEGFWGWNWLGAKAGRVLDDCGVLRHCRSSVLCLNCWAQGCLANGRSNVTDCSKVMNLFEGLILTIVAANISGIQGHWAKEMQLPFGSLAESIWMVVPLLFILVSIPALRKELGRLLHFVHLVALGCVLLPIVIFTQQTHQIRVQGPPRSEAAAAIRAVCGGRVLFVSDGEGACAYVPSSLDRSEVARRIFLIDPTLNPTHAESEATGRGTIGGESK